VPAFFACVLDARLASFGLNTVRCAALPADRLNAGGPLLDDNILLCHRLADQALGLLAHRLLRHSPSSVLSARGIYHTLMTIYEPRRSSLDNDVVILNVNRKGFGYLGALGEFLGAFDHDRI